MILAPNGQAIRSKDLVPMTKAEVLRFMEFERLLAQMGWHLVCAKCSKIYGYGKDGVKGDNDASDGQFHMVCGCSDHVFDTSGKTH